MAGEWKSVRLAELCEQIADCPHSTPIWTDSGVIVLRNQNIRNGRLDLGSPSYTDEAHFEQRSRRARLKAGDLVITREAPMGEVCMVPEDLRCCLGQRMVMLRANAERCDARFLLYSIQSDAVQHEIKVNEGTGSTVSNLRIPLLESLPIPTPPLAEQKAIAAVLGALDDKIELNRRMNATLEAMARALFQSWFVDFDPVRAKLDGRAAPGLDPATAALFSESFENSEIGRIPKGWVLTRLGAHVDLVRGTTYKSRLKDLPGPFLFGLGSIQRNGGFRDDSLRTYGGESAAKIILRAGDLFVSLKDVTQAADLLGAVARVPYEISEGRLTQDTVKLVPRDTGISFAYLYRLLLRPEYREYCRGRATGTTNLGLSREDFLNYPVLVPPGQLQRAFESVDSTIEAMTSNNRAQSRTLANLRDTLLPKLLSGELSVRDFEHSAEPSSSHRECVHP